VGRGRWLTSWVISKNKGAWPREGIEKWSSEANIRDKLKEKQKIASGRRVAMRAAVGRREIKSK